MKYPIITIGIVTVLIVVVKTHFFGMLDYNCSDFSTRRGAERVFHKNAEDIYHLDGDHNGIPCEGIK